MYLTMKRILLLQILTTLKIAVILANSLHSCFLCICKVIADIFQLPATHLLNDSPSKQDNSVRTIPLGSTSKVSIFTQTDKVLKQSDNIEEKSGTDVIIYNLNSSQKLIIMHEKFRSTQCERGKFTTEVSSSEKGEDVAASTARFANSNISYMSIESDILDSKIENCCSSSSNNSDEKASLNAFGDECYTLPVDIEDSDKETLHDDNDNYNSLIVDLKNFDNANLSAYKDRFNVSENFECLKEISDNTYVERNNTTLHKQKTSSPFKKIIQSPRTLFTTCRIFNKDQQSQVTENKDAGMSFNLDCWENGDTSGRDFKRRLSLPVKLNTTNTAVINFKLAQKKLIEDALKNTPRHEKSLKEIRYPFSSEISLGSRPNEEMEDKEVFSCSSYESLPVSDHLRNAFENNTLFNLYNENLHSKDGKPDFSSVDNLVEAFNDIKSSLSVANLTQSMITQSAMSQSDETEEKGLESLNLDGNLQQNSLDSQKLNDCAKLLNNSKDPKLSTDMSRMISNLTSELNSSKSVTDMCSTLDITSEEKLILEKCSRFFYQDALRNDFIKSGVNFRNDEQSEMKQLEVNNSTEKEFFGNSKLESEEENHSDENKLNQMKCTDSSSLKQMLPELCGLADDFEKLVLSWKHKGKTNHSDNQNSLETWQQSYNKIVFIDDSPSHKAGSKNQNISKTNYQDYYLKEEKPMLIEGNTSRDIEVETIGSDEYNAMALPAWQQSNEIIGKSSKRNIRKRNRVNFKSFASENRPMFSDIISNQTRRCTTRRMNQNILNTNYQDHPLNEDPKPMMHETVLRGSEMKTNESDCNDFVFPCWAQSSNKTSYIDQSSELERNDRPQNISEPHLQEHYSLNEDRKPMQFEENASLGDSTSDNSVLTVKDLSVAEN